MRNKITIFFVIFLVFSCTENEANSKWNILYKNDKEGKTLIGSKTELINAIRQGQDIKIGWGVKGENHSIEHLSEPIWLAILDEQEVIARLDPQIGGRVNWDSLSASYKDSQLREEWRVIITTKGEFDAVWYDRSSDSVIKRIPQNHVISWFSKNIPDKASPLFKE